VAEVIAAVGVEAFYVAYMKAQFASRSETARVATKVPPVRPDRMVRVSLIGTVRQTLVHFYSRLLVECWAESETEAAELAMLAYALTNALEGEVSGGEFVSQVVTVGGPANNPDPDVGPRYQFTVDLLMTGAVI
jgi:hypothetical protein